MNRLHYQIHEDTMYIVPVNNGGYIESRIGEIYGGGIDCRLNPNKLIERNCRNHSQNYAARKDLTKTLTGITSKLPVIVDLFGAYIYFCTHSDRIAHSSSVVELSAVNRSVVGSSPTCGAIGNVLKLAEEAPLLRV